MIDEAAFLDALEEHAAKPWTMTFDVASVFQITSLVQVALRHPHTAGPARAAAAMFISQVQFGLGQLNPVLGEVVALGNDPERDAAPLIRDERALFTRQMKACDDALAPLIASGDLTLGFGVDVVAAFMLRRSAYGLTTEEILPRTRAALECLAKADDESFIEEQPPR